MSTLQVSKIHSLTGHRDAIYTLQPSSSPDIFFSAAGDGMVVQWNQRDPENGQVIARLPNSIYALHHHAPTDKLIAGHNYDGIHVLDWQNKKETGSLQLTRAAIFDIQSFENSLLVGSGDGVIRKIDLETLQVTGSAEESKKSVRTIAVNPGRGELAAGYSDNAIRIFDLATLALKAAWTGHENSVFTLRYTPDGNFLISGSRDARLKAWDAQSGYSQAREVVAHMYAINHLDFSPDGKHFVTCSMDKSIKVWRTEDLQLLKVIDRSRHAGHGTSVNKLLWTTFYDHLASASDDRTISIWKIIF